MRRPRRNHTARQGASNDAPHGAFLFCTHQCPHHFGDRLDVCSQAQQVTTSNNTQGLHSGGVYEVSDWLNGFRGFMGGSECHRPQSSQAIIDFCRRNCLFHHPDAGHFSNHGPALGAQGRAHAG